MIIPVSVNPNETCQCPFSIRCQIFLISVVGGCWSLVRQPVLTHHSENKPTRHRKKQIPELHSTELSCLRQPCQRSASAPAAHPYEAAQATSLRMCSPPSSSMSDAEGCARQQLQGCCCCGPQAGVNRISVSVRASPLNTRHIMPTTMAPSIHTKEPASGRIEGSESLCLTHTHTQAHTHTLSLSWCRFVGLMDMVLTSIPTNAVTTASF